MARARPGDLESKETSRLALVDAPPPGTQEMRRSSTCIAEGARLDPLFCTHAANEVGCWERGALKAATLDGTPFITGP